MTPQQIYDLAIKISNSGPGAKLLHEEGRVVRLSRALQKKGRAAHHLVFTGTKGVGKSAFINRILTGGESDEQPLPSGLGARGITTLFTEISYAKADKFTVTLIKDGKASTGHAADMAELAYLVHVFMNAAKHRTAGTLFISGPFASLPPDITLVDCPGWGDASDVRLREELAAADAIVVVSSRAAGKNELELPYSLAIPGGERGTSVRPLPLFITAPYVAGLADSVFPETRNALAALGSRIGAPLVGVADFPQRFNDPEEPTPIDFLWDLVRENRKRERARVVASHALRARQGPIAFALGEGGATKLDRALLRDSVPPSPLQVATRILELRWLMLGWYDAIEWVAVDEALADATRVYTLDKDLCPTDYHLLQLGQVMRDAARRIYAEVLADLAENFLAEKFSLPPSFFRGLEQSLVFPWSTAPAIDMAKWSATQTPSQRWCVIISAFDEDKQMIGEVMIKALEDLATNELFFASVTTPNPSLASLDV